MDGAPLSIPLDQIANVVAFTQTLIFAAFFFARPAHTNLATWLLGAAFLIIAAVKADELYQVLGGFHHYPQYGFILSPLQAVLTPTLYLFVRARVSSSFRLRLAHLWHLTPTVLLTVYLTAIYFRFDTAGKISLLESGGLNTTVNLLLVPVIGNLIQISYLIASYRVLEKFGANLRNWFAQVEDRDLAWMKRLFTIWAGGILCHAVFTIAQYIADFRQILVFVAIPLNILHLALVNALALMGAEDLKRRAPGRQDKKIAVALDEQSPKSEKYASSRLSDDARKALFEKAQSQVTQKKLYLSPDLTLDELAAHLGASPRHVSEAINSAGGRNFFDFINSARIAHAQGLLLGEPSLRILDIGYQSGFNSKSAFNDAFKKAAGSTPSQYRRQGATPQKGSRSTAKPA